MKSEPLKKYYQNKVVADKYIERRFSSLGGKYVNRIELRTMLKFLPPSVQNQTVVEMGAGTGRLTREVLKLSPQKLIAVDSSEAMLKQLRKIKNRSLKIYHRSADKTAIPDKSADVVLSLRLFEHLTSDELDKVIKECHRILKKKGLLVFNSVNNLSVESMIHHFMEPSSSMVYPISYSQMINILKKNKFEIRETDQFFVIPRGIFNHSAVFLFYPLLIIERLLHKTFIKTISSHYVWQAIKK